MTYLTHKQLKISKTTYKYLLYVAKTLPKLSRPIKIDRRRSFGFNMDVVLEMNYDAYLRGMHTFKDFKGHSCGAAGCILGLMRYKAALDGVSFNQRKNFNTKKTDPLFFPYLNTGLDNVTNKQAGKAVKTFLKTGKVTFGDLDA